MKHGSLFSGIGGFDVAAEWMGWENVFHCEWNPFGQRVLKYHFPKSISYEDITKTDFTIHRGNIDILTGGFPCQPYSLAGKRKGKDDERHLWPEMLRAIREIQPTWVVGENVFGLINWNGGMVFDEVQADLEAEGYEVQPYVLPAAAVNAPHRRDRIWFVAYASSFGHRGRCEQPGADFKSKWEVCQNIEQHRDEVWGETQGRGAVASDPNGNWLNRNNCEQSNEIAKNTKCNGCVQRESEKERAKIWEQRNACTGSADGFYLSEGNATNSKSRGAGRIRIESCQERSCNCDELPGECCGVYICSRKSTTTWQNFPTQSPICGGDDGLPTELDGITFSKWRNESIKAFGNAIVPNVAHQIFKAIELYERNTTTRN